MNDQTDNRAGVFTQAPEPADSRAGRLSRLLREDLGRLLRTGVPHMLVAVLGTQGMSLIRRIVLARLLQVDEMGQMMYVMQIADFVAMMADMGICTAVLKYVSEPVSDRQREKIYYAGLLWSSISATIIAAIYLLIALAFPLHPQHVVRVFLLIVIPYIPLMAVMRIPLLFMQARKEIKRASRFTMFTQAVGVTVTVFATWKWGLWGFFCTVAVGPLVNTIILLLATRSHLHVFGLAGDLLRKLVSFGIVSMLANLATVANMTVIVVLLHVLTRSDDQVGILAIVVMIMTGIRLLPLSLLQVAFPYLSGLLNDVPRLRKRVRELSLKQSAVVTCCIAVWAILGSHLITLVFGAKYHSAYWPSVVMVASLLPFSLGAPFAQVAAVAGKVKMNLAVTVVMLICSTVLCRIMIPSMGVLGCTSAFLIAQVIASALQIVWVGGSLKRNRLISAKEVARE